MAAKIWYLKMYCFYWATLYYKLAQVCGLHPAPFTPRLRHPTH